ncbi:tyrosine-type recombinase/integrase [Sulfurimonas diazotrophicus]|uniref:Tyrosine-type recombinase/integrase n=1 Tax=Sulfurimonas diazotrophicus TaxID=3131939 RepID=A0ABZ3H9P2_9BACT
MEAVAYVKRTSKGLYKYRRRTPLELQDFIQSKEIIKSLGRDYKEASMRALDITQAISEAIQLTKLSSIPGSVVLSLLVEKLNVSSINTSTKEDQRKISYISKLYLNQSQVTTKEYEARVYYYTQLLPAVLYVLFKSADMDINELNPDKLVKIRKLIYQLPNKNHGDYKQIELTDLLRRIHKKSIMIPEEHRMSVVTINMHLKRVKSLLFYAKDEGLYTGNIPKQYTLQKKGTGSSRTERESLSPEERLTVFEAIDDADLLYVYKVLYYSGMRRSELYKCSLKEIEGVLCFDLTKSVEGLKTKSSYRVIPVHPVLMGRIEEFGSIVSSIKEQRMTKAFTRVLKKTLAEPDRKSLYSLRHSFATDLISNGVQPEIVSELMGHAHNTMTLSRYVKGYPVETLKKAIETLK